jgi:hypothetical protein
VNSENRANAWQFNGRIGNVNAGFPREEAFGAARCVGKP